MRIEQRTIPAQHTAVMKATLPPEQLGSWIPAAFERVGAYLESQEIAPTGMPVARYHIRPDNAFDVEAGFPVDAVIAGDQYVVPSSLPAGRVVVAWHIGPYERLAETYAAVDEWLKSEGAMRSGDAWEFYHDPPTGDPRFWRTEVVQPFTPVAAPAEHG